ISEIPATCDCLLQDNRPRASVKFSFVIFSDTPTSRFAQTSCDDCHRARQKKRKPYRLIAFHTSPPLSRAAGPLPRRPRKNRGFSRFQGSTGSWTPGLLVGPSTYAFNAAINLLALS